MARYKTGEKAPKTGTYTFAGYVNAPTAEAPTTEELAIPLSRGEVFPPIKSAKEAAYWKG